MQKWLVTIPPMGAAREVALSAGRAFSSLGIPAVTFDYGSYQKLFDEFMPTADDTLRTDIINQSLIVKALDHDAQVLLVNALTPISLFTLHLLRRQGITTVHWFYEDYRRAVYWQEILGGYNIFCAMQRGPLPQACAKTGTHFLFLPPAVEPALARTSPEIPATVDVAFIGIPSPYRIELLEFLLREGVSLALAGHGWSAYHGPLEASIVHRTWTDRDTANRIYSSARAGLNLSVDRPIPGDQDTHVSPRVYELALAGLPIISENVPLLSESTFGLKVSTFATTNELAALVKFHCAAPARPATASSDENIRAVTALHTYEQRIRVLVDQTYRITESQSSR